MKLIMASVLTVTMLTLTSTASHADDWVVADGSGWSPMQAGWDALNTQLQRRSSSPSNYASILNIIGRAESPRLGYDAVVYSARIKPSHLPSQMTISEIYKWIEETPGQNHAIGRYQFIPSTLRRVVTKSGLSTSQRFSEAVQDRLAVVLIDEAGFANWKSQRLSNASFMDNLARIWAGFPLANGQSAYRGVGNNRATVSRSQMQNALTGVSTSPTATSPAPSSSQDPKWVRADQW